MKIKLHVILIALIACLPVSCFQKKWALKANAEKAIAVKDWYGAEQYYYKLHKLDSSMKIRYNYAEACYLNYDYAIAYKMFNKVAAVDNGEKYPLAFYRLAQILKSWEKYKDARKWFVKFGKLNLSSDKYGYYIRKSKLEEDACDQAQLIIGSPLHLESEHLGDAVNSKVSEYAAFEMDSTLYFSTLRSTYKSEEQNEHYNKIYRVESKQLKWQKVKALDTVINSPRMHNANTCFSPDYKQMIVSRCKKINAADYNCELYLSRFVDKKWQPAQRMHEPVNLPNVNTTQANFGFINGKTVLFFASNRPGGEGGLDIWYSLMKEDGSFDAPVNAGKKINTPDDEISPWYVSARSILFFSSTYHKGLGGFDVFKSTYINGGFTEPENAGYPINSGYNDIYYSVNNLGTKIYLSSNRVGSLFEGKLNCCNDIFRFNIDTLKTKIVEPLPVKDTAVVIKEQLKLLVPLSLYFHNDEPDPHTKNITTDKHYDATYKDYRQLITSYANVYSQGLKGEEKKAAVNEINSFFSDSLDSGFRDLERFCEMLKKVLQNGETVRITFKGYCSPLASTDYNINLARRRVSSLRNYFSAYDKGWFNRYVNNTSPGVGKIIYEEVDVGELPVSRASDDFSDTRNSIYSPVAAGERKIQILAVSFGK